MPRFTTTRWTLIVAAREADTPTARAALAELCERYWYPVYAFIRRSGHDADQARDLTQGFFTFAIEKGALGRAVPERGRFRSFLLASVRHFLANEAARMRTLKRGGAAIPSPLELDDGERRFSHEPMTDETPEVLYDRRWALSVLERALERTRTEYADSGRGPLFNELRPFLVGEEPASYHALGEGLGMTESALRVAVHRLRQRVGAALRDDIADTVESTDDVEEELRYLARVLRS